MIFMKPNRNTVYKKNQPTEFKKPKVYIRQPSKTESIPNGKEIKYKGYTKLPDIKDKQLINRPPLNPPSPKSKRKHIQSLQVHVIAE